MKALPDGCVDAVITDPPYGVLTSARDGRGGGHGLAVPEYDTYQDTYENFIRKIVPRLEYAIEIATRAAVFTGPHVKEQRKAAATGGVYCPAACGLNCWGFNAISQVLFYGTAPNLNEGSRPTVIQSSARAERNGHPCPKPEEWMLWLVGLASRKDELVLDPFAGSGTTLIAAAKLGRHFLGFELSADYCRIARERIAAVEAQPTLFEKPAEQTVLNL